MSRYLLRFSYDGGSFHGFQIQVNAHTVQAELTEKISLVLGQLVELTGSSRTDTGVHAKEQFAHFDLPESILIDGDFVYRLNRMLSPSISVFHVYQVSDEFNARFDAISRTYSYYISTQKNPLQRNYAYWFEATLDVDKMNSACNLILNHQNFQCFSRVKTEVNTFECSITKACWRMDEDALIFTIQSNRFLRGMVRTIVGTLLEIGLGKWTQHDLKNILDSKDRSVAGRAVPAHGLHLIQVEYPSITFDAKCS